MLQRVPTTTHSICESKMVISSHGNVIYTQWIKTIHLLNLSLFVLRFPRIWVVKIIRHVWKNTANKRAAKLYLKPLFCHFMETYLTHRGWDRHCSLLFSIIERSASALNPRSASPKKRRNTRQKMGALPKRKTSISNCSVSNQFHLLSRNLELRYSIKWIYLSCNININM